jgi:hypothetical protein
MQVAIEVPEEIRAGITEARLMANTAMPQTVPNPEDPEGDPIPNPALYATDEAYFIKNCGDLALSYWRQKQIRDTVPPPAPAPAPAPNGQIMSITRKQGLKGLLRADDPAIGMAAPILESDILAQIEAMPETTAEQKRAKYDTLYEFKNAKTWHFNNQFTTGLQQMIGASDAQKRALFDLAATFTE